MGIVKQNEAHQFSAIKKRMLGISIAKLLELKEKCEYYRQTTNTNELYPYECVVWQFNIGPDAQDWGEKTIVQKLGITPHKVHESEWIGLHLLGWKVQDRSAYSSRVRTAQAIEHCWLEKQKAEKKAHNSQKEERQECQEYVGIKFLEDEILKTARERRKTIAQEIEQIRAIVKPLELELADWRKIQSVYEQLFEIEKKEEQIIEKLRRKSKKQE